MGKKVGLIDVDGHHYPNLALMKISAYHKARGDSVEWYDPMFSGHCDKVYMSKVFSFTPDFEYPIDADEIEQGGTGYCISLVNGVEVYDQSKDKQLPDEIEHIYPDYSLYPDFANTAFGYLSRGCPRGCDFCHVAPKEGRRSYKVADLNEFWRGQKKIELLDPNITACPDWRDLFQQLADSKAKVNFSQGIDIRLMTDEKAAMLSQINVGMLHFAWDKYEDKDTIQPKFLTFRKHSKINPRNIGVYCLTGKKSRYVLPEDIERVEWLKANGFTPYVMIYDKVNLPPDSDLKHLQQYTNNRFILRSCPDYQSYLKNKPTDDTIISIDEVLQ